MHVGIVTCSAEGAARFGVHGHPEVSLHSHCLADSRQAMREVIGRLVERGCAGVVLGCTEIPLLVGPDDAPVPLFDSTRLLARAALARAAG